MRVFFSVCCFFSTVMLTVFRLVLRTTIRAFRGVNNHLIHSLQRGLQLLRGFELSMGHQPSPYEGGVEDR